MRSRVSTGCLSPKANRVRNSSRSRRSESQSNANLIGELSYDLIDQLLKCPIKRQLVVNLVASEKDNIEKYKRKMAKENMRKEHECSPLSKIKKKYKFESPTALLRRRALEQQNRNSLVSNSNCSDTSSNSSVSSTIPFNKLLEGVVAYVEVKSKDQDRSKGVKALMTSMGAVINEKFTKDVTHVIFKDGSFTTYQKAKLMKVHLVSVLWIEAVRSSNMRVSEKKFPALGADVYDHNVSELCSQLQKDYEDIIREELNQSLITGTPLPSTKTIINRRKTVGTPSRYTIQTSQEFPSSQDEEVVEIMHSNGKLDFYYRASSTSNSTPELTSDEDSDVGVINGSTVKRKKNLISLQEHCNSLSEDLTNTSNSKSLISNLMISKGRQSLGTLESNMDLNLSEETNDINANKKNTPNTMDNSFYNKETPKIMNDNNVSKSIFRTPDEGLHKRQTELLKNEINNSSCHSTNISNENKSSDTNMSSLKLSKEMQILSRNRSSSMSALKLSPYKVDNSKEKSSSTNMSSLRISSGSNEKVKTRSRDRETSINLDMSSSSKRNSCNFGNSFCPNNTSTINNVLQIIISPLSSQYVTRRRRRHFTENQQSLTKTGTEDDLGIDNSTEEIEKDLSSKYSPSKKLKGRHASSSSIKSQNRSSATRKPSHEKNKSIDIVDSSDESEINFNVNKPTKQKQTDNMPTDISKTARNLRTLYDPYGYTKEIVVCDEIEREELRKKNEMQNSDESVFFNPNVVLINTYKVIDDNPNIEIISNEKLNSPSAVDVKLKKKKGKKNGNKIAASRNSDGDEQRDLAEEFIYKKNKLVPHCEGENGKDNRRKSPRLAQLEKNLNPNSSTSTTEANSVIPITPMAKKNDEGTVSNKKLDNSVSKKLPTRRNKKNKVCKSYKEDKCKSEGEIIKRRKSIELSQSLRKKLNYENSIFGNEQRSICIISPVANRRSTMEFQKASQSTAKRKLKIDKSRRPSIVCTKMHKDDIEVFNQIVKKLGGFVIEDEVSSDTTHLVAGEPKRTINMLKAIASGCWVLKHEWLLKSLEEGKWLPEEDFEETGFSPAVQQCRLQRQAFGPLFSMDIFQDCGSIYIARGSIPRCSDLKDLVTLCTGKVVTVLRNASVVVGGYVKKENITCVKETWILDSITFNMKMSLKKYILSSNDNGCII